MKAQSTFTTMPLAARYAIAGFAILGLAVALYASTLEMALSPVRLLLLLAAAVLGSRAKVDLFRGSTLSLLTSVVMLAVNLEGLAGAILVAVVGVTAQVVLPARKFVFHQLAFNAGMITLTVTATWLTHRWLATADTVDPLFSALMATVIASFTYFLGNSISVSLIIALTKGISMAQVWFNHFLPSATSFIMAGVLASGVFAMSSTHGIAVVFAFVLIVALGYCNSVRMAAAPSSSTGTLLRKTA